MPPRSPLTLLFRFWFSCHFPSFFVHFCFRRSLLLRLRFRPRLLVYFLLFRSFLLSSVPTTQTQTQTLASRLFPPFSFFLLSSVPTTQTLASRLFYDIDSKGKQCKPVLPFCTFLNPISSTQRPKVALIIYNIIFETFIYEILNLNVKNILKFTCF